jgi:hypothetical protein
MAFLFWKVFGISLNDPGLPMNEILTSGSGYCFLPPAVAESKVSRLFVF